MVVDDEKGSTYSGMDLDGETGPGYFGIDLDNEERLIQRMVRIKAIRTIRKIRLCADDIVAAMVLPTLRSPIQ